MKISSKAQNPFWQYYNVFVNKIRGLCPFCAPRLSESTKIEKVHGMLVKLMKIKEKKGVKRSKT